MYINGQWIKTNNQLDIINPATGELVDRVDIVGKREVEMAIKAAESAFSIWSNYTAEHRARYLEMVVERLKEKKEHFASIITKEMGKSIHNARYEVNSTIGFFKWYAEEARRVYGDTIPASSNDKRITVIRQPVGVVGAITPWNFPLSMAARKLGPALAVGCSVIIKPSSEAPLSVVELFKIFDEVEFPKGVVNLLIGKSNEIAEPLLQSKTIRKISFTGSTEVGKLLIRQSADTVKKVSMELGGHAPFIVFEDADIDLAVEGMIKNKFVSTGQQCVCANRIYVHKDIYEEFSKRAQSKIASLKVGNGLDESVQIGSMTNENGIKKVENHIDDAVKKGAKVLFGGHRLTDGEFANGLFYSPTLLSNVKSNMKICYEETFGPVAPLISFDSEEEVIKMANDIEYGLASYFYTKDLSRTYRVSEKLEYGMVGVNDPAPFAVQAPFGGVKESGLGREGGYYGLDDYLETKLISVGIEI